MPLDLPGRGSVRSAADLDNRIHTSSTPPAVTSVLTSAPGTRNSSPPGRSPTRPSGSSCGCRPRPDTPKPRRGGASVGSSRDAFQVLSAADARAFICVGGGRVRVRAISAAASPDRGPQGRTGSHPWTPLLLYAGVPRRQAPTRSVARGSDLGTTSSGGFHHGLERLIQGWQCASIGFRRRSFSRFSTPHSVLILSAVRTCHRGVPEESGPHHISCIVSSVALGMKDTPLLEHLAGRSNASRRRADDPPGIDAAVTRPSGQAGRPGPLLRCGASTPASVGAAAPRPAQPSLTTLAQGHERLRPHGGPGPPNPPGPNP
jgi:hypothetical protein